MRLHIIPAALLMGAIAACSGDQEHGQNPAEPPAAADTLTTQQWTEKGMQLALETKAALGKNLVQAIQSKGTAGAVAFCSEHAYPITDSMAVALGATIKRVSDRNRNPGNAANANELLYIQQCRSLQQQDQPLKPQVQISGKQVSAYYPILTDAMCLQCHGIPEKQVLPETLTVLNTLYPSDKATGFAEGDLRGIWVITMQK